MSWKAKIKEMGGGDVTFLSSDGECLVCVIVDDPVVLKGKYKGKESERVGCPVVTDEGFLLFITGKRVARKISKFEERFKEAAFMIVRHGVEDDVNSTYAVSILPDKEKTEQLLAIAKKDYKPAMLKDAVAAAEEIMKG